jgi:hypothetical protein
MQMADQQVMAFIKDILHLNPSDVAIQAASLSGGLEDRCKREAKSLRLNWPVTPKDLVRASLLFKSQEPKDWESLASQVNGVKDFRNDPLGNSWLYDPTVLSSSR